MKETYICKIGKFEKEKPITITGVRRVIINYFKEAGRFPDKIMMDIDDFMDFIGLHMSGQGPEHINKWKIVGIPLVPYYDKD